MEIFVFLAIICAVIAIVKVFGVRERVNSLEQRIEKFERGDFVKAVPTQERPQVVAETPYNGDIGVPQAEPAPWVLGNVSQPISIERMFGGNILTKIGIVALLFGFGFLFKYAFDNDWIGPIGVTMLGIFVGIILLGLGEYFHKKYRIYGQTLTGGGIGVLYLSLFASFSLYHLVGQYSAFFLMILVTVMSGILAVRYDALALAMAGIVGGFLTPFLVSTGQNNLVGLFTYIIILNVGILAISIFKQWRELNFAGLVGTFLVFIAWALRFYTPAQLWQTEFFITAFFIIFSLSTIIYLLFRTAPIVSSDMLMMVGVPTVYALVSYSLLNPDYHQYMGFFALILAMWYFMLAFLGYHINKSDKNLVNGLGLVALIFVTVAVPLQLEQSWITMMWGLEALVLLVIGILAAHYYLRVFAHVVLAFTILRLFLFEWGTGNLADYTVIFNKRFFIFFVVVLIMSAMAFLYRKLRTDSSNPDFLARKILFPLSQLLLFIILNVEVLTYWDKQMLVLNNQIHDRQKQETFVQNNNQYPYNNAYYGNYTPQEKEQIASLRNKTNISLSVFWVLYGISALTLGVALKNRYIRLAAIGLFGLVILKVFFVDMGSLSGFYRITSFIGLGVILIIVGFIYQRYKEKIYAFIT